MKTTNRCSVGLALLCGICAAKTAAAQPNFTGNFDVGDCTVIAGWAADLNQLNTPIHVSIFVDDTLLTPVLANALRNDVADAIGDNGQHGFNFPTPSFLKTGAPRSIGIRFESTTIHLVNSPRTITCAPAAYPIGGPKITSFKIQSDSNKTTTNPNLTLEVEFDRAPSFYRMGEMHTYQPEEELRNRPWQAYTPGMSFTFNLDTSRPYGTRVVNMQINSGTSESGASPPKGDSVILAPLGTKTFTLTGQALTSFLNRATAIGYRFRLSGPSYDGAYPCPLDTVVDPQTEEFRVVTGYTSDPVFTETRIANLFQRPDGFLNPFWKMTAVAVADFFRPENPSLVSIHGPFTGRVDDPSRRVGFKRSFSYPEPPVQILGFPFPKATSHSFRCVPVGEPIDGPSNSAHLISLITSITLVGPDDKTPKDALFPPPIVLAAEWLRRGVPLPLRGITLSPMIPQPEP